MTTTTTRRITSAIAGSTFAAMIFAGVASATPVQATPTGPMAQTTCSAPIMASQTSRGGASPLTRAGQLQTAAPARSMSLPAVTCT